MRKNIAQLLQIYWEFIKRHPLIGLVLSLAIFAASAGALYLIVVNFPSYIPCLTGACS